MGLQLKKVWDLGFRVERIWVGLRVRGFKACGVTPLSLQALTQNPSQSPVHIRICVCVVCARKCVTVRVRPFVFRKYAFARARCACVCVCTGITCTTCMFIIYIYIVCLVFVTFFLILRMPALTPMMFALILMMLSLILLEPCSDSQGCRLFRLHQPLFVSPQAYFPAMSAWLVLILPSRSGRQDAEYKIGGRAISKYKKNSTQYKKHPRTGLQGYRSQI